MIVWGALGGFSGIFPFSALDIQKAKAATFSMQTGYYVGTGASKSITGLGFTPNLVMIKADDTSGVGMVVKSSAMPASHSQLFAGTSANDTNTLITLDADGFTVSSGANVNTSGVRWEWVAFGGSDCTASGTFCVGTYSGTGAAQSISTGFQPDLVVTRDASTVAAIWKSSAMGANENNYFHAAVADTGGQMIKTLDATGFTVGTGNNANQNGHTFYFFAFKQVAGAMDVGTYTGTGANKTISSSDDAGLTFQSDFTFMKNSTNAAASGVATFDRGNFSVAFTDLTAGGNFFREQTSTGGFKVGTFSSVNGNGAPMYYATFGGAASLNTGGTYRYASGTYTGTGSALSVTGLGFRPDLVIVKGAAAQYAFFRTSLVPGDKSFYLGFNGAGVAALITSIDSDGFSIGTNGNANTNGVVHYWEAFGNAWNPETNTGAKDFTIGAYTGSGVDSRDISRLPFTPDLVAVKDSPALSVTSWRTSAMSGDLAHGFSTIAAHADIIQSIGDHSFQVGVAAQPYETNTSGDLCYFFAFASSSYFSVGTYTGTGLAHDITGIGNDPDLVWVQKRSGGTARAGMFLANNLTDGNAQYFVSTANAANKITALGTNLFTVGTGNETNESTYTYDYAAWESPPTSTPAVSINASSGSTDVSEAGTTDTYTVVLNYRPTSDVTVSISPDAQTTVSTSSIVFTNSNWSTAQTITVSAVNDSLAEGSHTSSITHTASSSDSTFNNISISSETVNITDNDTAGFTVSAISGNTTEVGGTASFTVVLTSQPSGTVTTTVHSSDTTEGTITTSTLVFNAASWNLPRTVTVTGVDDSIDDGDIAYSIILDTATSSDPNYDGVNPSNVSVTNTDNDTAGVTVTESAGTTNITEGGATDSYTIVLNSQPTENVFLALSPDAQSTLSTSSIVFTTANWDTAQTITVTAVNDSVVEGAHTSTITQSATSTDGTYNAIPISSVVASITDNDTAGFTLSAISGNTSEAGGSATFTVVLDSQPSGTVTTTVHSSDTTEGTVNTSTLVFTAASWNLPRTVTVTGVDDLDVDGDIAYSIILDTATSSDPNYDGLNPADVSVTNTDNEAPAAAGVTITQSAGTTNVTEAGATDTYTIVLNSLPTGNVFVNIASDSQLSFSTSSIIFSTSNWNVAQTITVTALDDNYAESAHSATITHSATSTDSDYNALGIASVTANITDNDTAGVTITQSAGTTDITEAGGTDSYTVVLTSAPTGTLSLALSPDAQCTLSTSSLSFTSGNWNSAVTVTVTAVNDSLDEGGHTCIISHTATSTNANYDGIAVDTVTANITDNDTAGFTLSAISGNTSEAGGTATFTVVLDSQPSGTVTTTVHSSDTTEGTVNTSTLVFTAASWNLPRTVTVTGVDDSLDDGDIAYSIILDTATSSDPNYDGLNPADVSVSNTDNDTVGVSLLESAASTDIAEGAGTDSYTIVLDAQPTANVFVHISADAQSTVSTSSLVFTSSNWSTPQTITVSAVDDALAEGPHDSTITHSVTSTDPGYDAIAVADIVAHITDNDDVGFTLSAISGNTSEAGATATFTVVMTSQPTAIVTTSIHSFDTTEGTINTSTLVFHTDDWDIPRTITVTGVDDVLVDGDIAYSIILDPAESDDLNYNGFMPGFVALSNIDDDIIGISLVESAGSTDIEEAGLTDSYTLVLDTEPTENVTVTLSPDAQSTLSTSSIVFTPTNWNVAQTITLSAVNDSVAEGGHTTTITHTVTSLDPGYDGFALGNVVALITDNDSAGFDVSGISGETHEDGTSATFTVVLTSQPTGTVTTTVYSTDSSEGVTNTSTLVFTALDWNIPRTVTVTGVNDDIDDGNQAYTIILDTATSSDPGYNGMNPNDVDMLVNIDDDTAGITLQESDGSSDITEGGNVDTYTIVLNSEPTGNVAVRITPDAQSTLSTSSILFNTTNWNIARTVTMTAVDDGLVEGPHISTITHSVTSTDPGYDAMLVADVNANITDNAGGSFIVSLISGNTSEAGATATFTVVLGSAPTGVVTTTLHSSAPTEGTINTSTLVFDIASWNLPRTVTVTGVDDALVDGNIDYSIILDTASSTDINYDGLNPDDVSVTNTDNDTRGVIVTQSAGTTDISEAGATDTYTLLLNSEPTGDVAISITPDAQSSVSSSSLVFTALNWNVAQTITLTAINDAVAEGDHTSTITHTATSTDLGYDGIAIDTVTANITDNDAAGFTVSLISGDTSEDAGTATFTVVLDSPPSGRVTTTLHSSDTTEGTINTSTLVFDVDSWNLPRTVTVTGVDDELVDGNIAYSIILDTASSTDVHYAGLNPADVSVTNTDNDTVGITLVESAGTTDITEGGAADSYTVVLNSEPTANVTVSISSDAQSTLSTSSILFTTTTWNIARTISVTAVNDHRAEGPHTSSISHTVTSTDLAYDGLAIPDVVANVTDNDNVGITLTESGGTTNSTEGAVTDSYTLVLTSEPSSTVAITLTPDTQVSISTSSISFSSSTWNIPQTITVTAIDDSITEGGHVGIINHAVSSDDTAYNAVIIADLTTNITDNDSNSVVLTESGGITNITEAGATDSYTVVLSSEPLASVFVSIASDAQSTLSTTSIQFTTTTWNIPQTITLTAVNDLVAEGAHDSTITHTVTSTDIGYDAIIVADITAHITDNDTAGVTLAQSAGTTNIAEGGVTDSYTIVLNSKPSADVTITLTPDAQSTVSTSSIIFTTLNWNVAQTITLTAEDDGDVEGPHTSVITHSADSLDAAYNAIAIADLTANVIDNDTPGVTITESLGTTDITEGGIEDSYTIVLNALPLADVTITLTPDAFSDVSTSSLVFNVANWNVPRIVTSTAIDDAISQGPHVSTITHTVSSLDPNYDLIATSDVVANITDNDTAGITVSAISGNTSEAGATSTYTVVLDSEPTDDVFIPVSSSDVSEATVDQLLLTFTSLNWNIPQTITVTGVDDRIADGPMNYALVNALASSTDNNYDGRNPADVDAINTDNDVAGISLTQSGGVTNVTEGGATDTYTLVLESEPVNDVTITISPDAQSTVSTSSIVFTATNWNIEQTITVTAFNDDVMEDPHDSIISAAATSLDASYNGIVIADVTAHITDNDTAGFTVSLISGDTSEAGSTATFSVVLNSEPTGIVTTSLSSSDLTEGTVSTSTLLFSPADWDMPRVVTVSGVNDHFDDGDIDFTIVLDAAVSGDANYNGLNPDDVSVTNIDDDGVGVNIQESAGSSDVSEAGSTDSYTLVLGSMPTADVVITLASDAQTTLSTSSITFTPDNWNISQEVTISAVDDAVDEGAHTSTLTASAASLDILYNGIAIVDITVHISDNDGVIDPVKAGGGGGAITIPSIPIIPRVENLEQSEKSIIFASKDTEILNFSSSSHRVIRVSATVEDAVLVIESDPIVVRLKKDIPQILDTDKNGIPDLRVVYDGLVGKNPKFTFTELQELLAVFINNGAKQTFSHRVHLQFNVVNAAFVALSNNPDFRDATFQTFTTNSVWALPFGDGEKTVYVRFRSKSGGVFDSSASIRLVHSMTACSLNLGRPYKSPDSSAVYYITPPYNKDGQPIEGPCTKRPFKSPASFFSYFGSWGDVQIVSKSELANIADDALGFMPRGPRYAPQNGTLMKVVSDPKVYLLIDGKKHIINNEEVFNSLGFHWDEVEDVAAELLDTFSVGDTIVKNQAPLLSVIQYPDSPRLYFLEKSPSDDSVIVKRYITSESAWKSLKYRIDRVIRLSGSSVYQDGNPIGQEAPVSVESQSPSQNFVFTHSLALNDTGEEVEALQKILAANGYFNHEVTGLYGPVTVEAVKAFQVAHGLEALGIVGPGTRSLLNSL